MGDKVPKPEVETAAPQAADALNPPPEGPKPGERRAAEADDAAKQLTTDEKLPDNEWSSLYYQMKEAMEKEPKAQGPLMGGVLKLLAGIARMMKYADLLPGHFVRRLDSDSVLVDEKLNKEELEKIVRAKRDVERERKAGEALAKKVKDAEKEKKTFNIERASTMYVASAIGMVDSTIDDPSVLAAKLQHSLKAMPGGGYAAFYRPADLKSLKANGAPFGTVIVFATGFPKGERVAAFATGNSDEFKYFDPSKGGEVSFKLSDNDSPVSSDTSLLAAYVPTFNSDAKYFAAHPDEVDERTDESVQGELRGAVRAVDNAEVMVGSYGEKARQAGETAENTKKYADSARTNIEEPGAQLRSVAERLLAGEEKTPQDIATVKAAMDKIVAAIDEIKKIYEKIQTSDARTSRELLDEEVGKINEIKARLENL